MNSFEQDVFSQPSDVRSALNYYREQGYYEKIRALTEKKFDKIVMTGMGSSYSACMNAATKLRIHGYNCIAQVTSQLLHYEMSSIDEKTLLIVVSQSGRSGEIVELVKRLTVPCVVVGVTNDDESQLGIRADLILNIHVRPELAVSTRTYLASFVIMELFVKAFLSQPEKLFFGDMEASIANLENDITRFNDNQKKMESFWGAPPYLALIGRGYDLCTVDAGALFIKELAKYPSISFDAGQFRHGPFEMSGPEFHAIIFATEGPGCQMQLGLARDIADKGGKIIVVTNNADIEETENIAVIRQKFVSEELACIGNILPVQCFGNYIAKKKGLKVGEFIYSSKITTVQ